MAGAERERESLGKLLVSALERITTLRNISTNETQDAEASQPMSVAAEMSRLFPSIKVKTDADQHEERERSAFATTSRKRSNSDQHKRSRKLSGKKAKSTSSATNSKPINKDLVFLPSKSISSVPTHKKRLELENQDFIIHGFPFERHWSERELRVRIAHQFRSIEATDFEFLKASYGTLIKPKLADGVEMTGDLLLRISGQGAVYIRTNNLDEQSSDEEDESMFLRSPFETPTFNDDIPPILLEQVDLTGCDNTDDQQAIQLERLTSQSPNETGKQVEHQERDIQPMPESQIQLESQWQGCQSQFENQQNDLQEQLESHASIMSEGSMNIPVENLAPICTNNLPVREIAVNRDNVLKDMIREFLDDGIMNHKIEIVFIDQRGEVEKGRGAGLLREALSVFWREYFMSLSVGAEAKVPSIRHDYQKAQWESVARVLVVGFIQANYFPISMSLAFFASSLFGEESVSSQVLIESFHKYVSKDECETLQKCNASDSDEYDPADDDDVLDFLSSYKCYRVPTKEAMPNIILELAHQEIIQKPKYIANAWSPIIAHLKSYVQFKNVESLKEMYSSKKPTAKKIIKLLNGTPSSDAERQCFDHLKRFIKSLDDNLLCILLQFISGSNIISTEKIDLAFNTTSGNLRSPTAHTCGPLLVIPSTYQTYNELSEEFTHILRASASWSFGIV